MYQSREIFVEANFREIESVAFTINVCASVVPRPFSFAVRRFRSTMVSFSVEAMVREYHVYKDVWTAPVGFVVSRIVLFSALIVSVSYRRMATGCVDKGPLWSGISGVAAMGACRAVAPPFFDRSKQK